MCNDQRLVLVADRAVWCGESGEEGEHCFGAARTAWAICVCENFEAPMYGAIRTEWTVLLMSMEMDRWRKSREKQHAEDYIEPGNTLCAELSPYHLWLLDWSLS